jgi:ubiquinol-cytochrome c reductase cytochrome c1 subunit
MRFILGFIGSVFALILLIALVSDLGTYFTHPPAPLAAAEFHKEPKELTLPSDGPFGKFDKAQLQRGLQVYSEVCKSCHSLKNVSFRDLKGLGYTDPEIKAFAKQWDVPSLNPDTGEPATRKGLPSDNFPSPYANEIAGRAANNNALPPDLSLMTKAREGGPDYVYSILTGYQNQPADLLRKFPDAKTPPNLHYNPYFANLNLAMPPPLHGGDVTFADGTPNTLQNEARDVAAFLVWTAEPNLETRHAAGIAVTVFLLFASVLSYLAYRQIWHDAKREVRATGPLEPANQAKARSAKGKAKIAG